MADIHIDQAHAEERLTRWIAALTSEAPDVLLVCGDMASDFRSIETCLHSLSCFGKHRFFVPGNHDIWIESKNQLRKKHVDSSVKYREILPKVVQEAGFHPLWVEPVVVDGVGFAGTMGWYDYSLRNPALGDLMPYHKKSYRNLRWNDGKYAWWCLGFQTWKDRERRRSDRDVCGQMVSDLQSQLECLSRKDLSCIVVATHTVPFRELMAYTGQDDDFFCAYAGSEDLGKTITRFPQVALTVCGHFGRPKVVQIGNTKCVNACERLVWAEISPERKGNLRGSVEVTQQA